MRQREWQAAGACIPKKVVTKSRVRAAMDGVAGEKSVRFSGEIDERVFDIMQLFGWVADLKNKKYKIAYILTL